MTTPLQLAQEYCSTIATPQLVEMLQLLQKNKQQNTTTDATALEAELSIIGELEMRIQGLTQHLDKWVDDDMNTATQLEATLRFMENNQ